MLVKIGENEYSLNTILPFLTHQQKFTPNIESDQTTVDGRKIKNIFVIEGNVLTERQIEPTREVTIIRKFYATEMLGTSIVGKITNKHWSVFLE